MNGASLDPPPPPPQEIIPAATTIREPSSLCFNLIGGIELGWMAGVAGELDGDMVEAFPMEIMATAPTAVPEGCIQMGK